MRLIPKLLITGTLPEDKNETKRLRDKVARYVIHDGNAIQKGF